jgi:recombinational DNA repair ATPase RecF
VTQTENRYEYKKWKGNVYKLHLIFQKGKAYYSLKATVSHYGAEGIFMKHEAKERVNDFVQLKKIILITSVNK